MGIKNLNKYLLGRCSQHSIKKIHLSELSNKTLIIDTSIYLYKFVEKNMLLENIYLMISIFRNYNIIPVFVFDGKPPIEKNELLEKRRADKKIAEDKYYVLKREMESGDKEIDNTRKEDILNEMEMLKKRFVRIRDEDIRKAKELMGYYGIMYLESYGEADQLCAYLTKHQYAWACVSDDMDMFVYGCQRVLRHMSLLHHTAILYDTNEILNDLNMPFVHFKEILVLSGTDYNLGEKHNLFETMKWYYQYVKYALEKGKKDTFYNWLSTNTKYIQNRERLNKVYSMFDLNLFALNNHEEIRNIIQCLPFCVKTMDIPRLKSMMEEDGFLFV